MDSQPPRIIALVDDDAGVRDSLRFLLETAGYKVESYASGTQFLAEARPASISCLVLDHKMPQLTGLELLAQLRAAGLAPPTLLVTSMPSPSITRRAAELGALGVLEKPFTQDDLLACLEAATGSGQKPGLSVAPHHPPARREW
ncbi:response regulator [Roseomonas sp. E05]|uniref:response regulator transcription factor n=1 Tax=Roseomonas sp. E05 TaxID=3046310 RepID=UPI0024BB25AA|nr:response regulator [Roseomonas sp. E05]MDJ0390520.1 response regulator [Roseomonas sp. E05]